MKYLRALCQTTAVGFLISSTVAAADAPDFVTQVQPILEQNCVACHGEDKDKGAFRLNTRAGLIEGGDTDLAVDLKKPKESLLLKLVRHEVGHDDIMPPTEEKGKDGKVSGGPPLTAEQVNVLESWLVAGAPWPEGLVLKPKQRSRRESNLDQPDPNLSSIEVFPKKVSLETSTDFHRLIIIGHYKDASTRDVTPSVDIKVIDPKLIRIDGTTLYPKADGKTSIEISYRGKKSTIEVSVIDAAKARPVSFRRDVMPVITSSGCNTGSCHGSARGQDGFNLSLFGYDPEGDHFRITKEMPGRRLNLALPEDSLILTKATEAVPHTGGKLFEKDSDAYRVILQWIKDGAKYDGGEIVHPVSIEVRPNQAVLKGVGEKLPLTVRAIYSDGSDRDVTKLTTFTTSNDNSVEIDARSGLMTSAKRGESFLMGRFQTFTEGMQTIVIPENLSYTKPQLPAANYIDGHVYEKLHKLRVIPSEVCDDTVFVRRVYIDLIGRLPSPEDRAAFLADTNKDKRAALVDKLLNTKEFTEIWVMKWAELLQIRTFQNQVSYKAALLYHNWLRERIASNTPFNEIVRELLMSKGGTFSTPATNFFQVELETLKLTENVAQVFMGTRIQCAQCHNHPFDRWTMDDYYSFAAFFAQVKRKKAEDPREQIIYDGSGQMQHPLTKQNSVPKFLGGEIPDTNDKSRRELVANWLTTPENPWFARNVSNIIWSHFFGIGIVEPVDDMRISNPPSNPELLDDLAKHFVEYNFDLKRLVRDICTSRTYQRSTHVNESNESDTRNFSHANIRRLRAEVLLDVVSQVTTTPNKFKGLPKGARAVQIADGNTSTYFLKTFGRATRETVCSCEVKMDPSLSQALHLLNGDTTHNRIRGGQVVVNMLKEKKSPEEIIKHLYLTCLSRPPTDTEMGGLKTYLEDAKDFQAKREVLEDVFWALLNSKEFIFNH
ncbi:surface protein [Oceaniferula spumae]|uniref:Surface protein n=1 Tax=Oceaniferula spumae TaxID=2979115 RepID=A0AAT9FPQ1_9BACT